VLPSQLSVKSTQQPSTGEHLQLQYMYTSPTAGFPRQPVRQTLYITIFFTRQAHTSILETYQREL